MEGTTTLPKKTHIRIRWDEETIAEHDKERGTRQKIDEPNTPFAHHPGAAEEESNDDMIGVNNGQKREPERRLSFDEKVSTVGQSMSIFDNWEGMMSMHRTASRIISLMFLTIIYYFLSLINEKGGSIIEALLFLYYLYPTLNQNIHTFSTNPNPNP